MEHGTFVLEHGVELHRNADCGIIRLANGAGPFIESRDSPGRPVSRHQRLRVDGFIVDTLALCDGSRDWGAISDTLNDRHGPMFGPMLGQLFLDWADRNAHIVRRAARPADARGIAPTGTASAFYPEHCIFEIIETCNFACDHCYYSSSPFKKGICNLDDAITIMDRLHACGVRVIELSGGECTIHPKFDRILAHAAQRFEMVALISNGYRIGTNDRTLAAITACDNVVVQISIDAMDRQHDAFRKHRGAFSAAVSAVEKLVAAGLVVRIASSISAENIDDVVPLYELGQRLGATRHSFTAVAPIGRGCNVSDSAAGSSEIAAAINAALAPFADDPRLGATAQASADGVEHATSRNCGAGWRTFTVDYDGDVRACNLSRDSKAFGNVLADGPDTLFGQKANFMFSNAPSPGGQECFGCDFYAHCQGCFVKAFTVSETEYPECPWRARWFPDMPLALSEDRHTAFDAGAYRASLPQMRPLDDATACSGCQSCAGTATPG